MNHKQMKPRGEGDFDIGGVLCLPSLCWRKILISLGCYNNIKNKETIVPISVL